RIERPGIRLLRVHGAAPDHQGVALPVIGDDVMVGGRPCRNDGHLPIALRQIDVEFRFQYLGFGLERGTGKESANRHGDHTRAASKKAMFKERHRATTHSAKAALPTPRSGNSMPISVQANPSSCGYFGLRPALKVVAT